MKTAIPYKLLTIVVCLVRVVFNSLENISSARIAGTVCGWMPSTVKPFNIIGGQDEVGNTSIL